MTVKRYVTTPSGDVVDAETGEVATTGFVAIVAPRERSQFGQRFLNVSQNQSEEIASKRHELGIDGLGILFYLMGRLDYQNMIQVSQADISRALNIHQPHVSRAMTRLVDAGIIEKGPTVNGRCSYRLSPAVGWKGSASDHRRVLAERMKAARMKVVS